MTNKIQQILQPPNWSVKLTHCFDMEETSFQNIFRYATKDGKIS